MKSNNLDILKQKGSGFKVPEGYFNTVEDTIISELITEKFPEKHGFSIPKGYLEAIETSVSAKLSAEQLPDKEGFTTPKGYFDSVEDTIFAKLGKQTRQINTSDIPEGYFDTLEDRVFTRLKEEIRKEPKVISLSSRVKKVLIPVAVAASLLLIFIIGYNSGSSTTIDEVANTEIEKWIEEDLINLDSYEIAEIFNDVNLASNETSSEEDTLLDYLNGTDIENMLLEN